MNKTLPSPYPELNAVLQELVSSIRNILQDNFIGAYLQGSFAIGDFDQHSDVDFIIVTQEELSEGQVDALQHMHERIYRLPVSWAQHLEGSYFPKDVLKDYTQRGEEVWYVDHGATVVIRHNHCNTMVVRWTLREKGITLHGAPPATLVDPIPVEMLRKEIQEVIHEWGQEILTNPEHFNNRFYQAFILHSYCRMLHSLQVGYPASKLAGTQWAKANLDAAWSDLIDRSWSGRQNPAVSVRQPADPHDFARTLDFVRYVIDKARLMCSSASYP
jgi:predicted nucleotidyltransferase